MAKDRKVWHWQQKIHGVAGFDGLYLRYGSPTEVAAVLAVS